MKTLIPSPSCAGVLLAFACVSTSVARAETPTPVETAAARGVTPTVAGSAGRKSDHAHQHKEVRLAPVRPERGNYQPVIPPQHVVIPK